MANRFYETGASRAKRVNDLFAAVAPRYDLINDLQSLGLHRGWKRKLVQLAEGRPGQRALDLCCGTGDVAFALADAGLETIGLDFSQPMLTIARQRAARRQQAKAQSDLKCPVFIQGDAQAIPYPENSFDLATISYGL